MKLFGLGSEPSAVEIAEQQVARAQSKHADLTVQLHDVEKQLIVLRAEAVDHAMECGRLDDDRADAIASAVAGCDTLTQAVARASAELAQAQTELAAEQDRAQRSKSIAEIEALQVAMKEPAAQLVASITKLLPLVKRGAVFSLDLQQVGALMEQWAVDASAAVEIANTGLLQHVQAIQSGQARARLPPAEESKPVARPAPPAQVGVLPKYSISWTDHLGQTRTSAPYIDQGLPPETAQKAIAAGIVVASDSDEARKLRRKRSGFAPDLNALVDLDSEHPQPPPPQPERWMRPGPTATYSDVRQTAGPLTSWTGQQSWMRPTNTPTNNEGF